MKVKKKNSQKNKKKLSKYILPMLFTGELSFDLSCSFAIIEFDEIILFGVGKVSETSCATKTSSSVGIFTLVSFFSSSF